MYSRSAIEHEMTTPDHTELQTFGGYPGAEDDPDQSTG